MTDFYAKEFTTTGADSFSKAHTAWYNKTLQCRGRAHDIEVPEQLDRLSKFLGHLGYVFKAIPNQDGTMILHIVATFKAKRINSSSTLSFEQAVSIYNYGAFRTYTKVSHITHSWVHTLVAYPEWVKYAYNSKPDDRPLTLQRSQGGIIAHA